VRRGRFSSEAEVVEESLRLLERQDAGRTNAASEPALPPDYKPIWEIIDEIMADVPPEELAKLPIDGAEQHDHYIYGTPKRPT
jgi:Arc/MetJ-type ribon-helix-helix transcriptional regulator